MATRTLTLEYTVVATTSYFLQPRSLAANLLHSWIHCQSRALMSKGTRYNIHCVGEKSSDPARKPSRVNPLSPCLKKFKRLIHLGHRHYYVDATFRHVRCGNMAAILHWRFWHAVWQATVRLINIKKMTFVPLLDVEINQSIKELLLCYIWMWWK